MLVRDRKLKGPLSLVLFALLAVSSVGPLGCEPPMPPMPQFPKAEAPAVDLPKPPEPQAPTPPHAPTLPAGGGNCCLRAGNPVAREKCGGGDTCCVKDFDNSDDCESHKGFWFFSKDGCAGAC